MSQYTQEQLDELLAFFRARKRSVEGLKLTDCPAAGRVPFPDRISREAQLGPGYLTDVVVVSRGHEQRSTDPVTWSGRFEVGS